MGFHIIGTAFGVLTIWASFLSALVGGSIRLIGNASSASLDSCFVPYYLLLLL